MTEERKKDIIIFAVLGAVIWLFSRPKTSVRYRQEVGTMTALQLAENFKEMISSPLRVYVNPVNADEPDTGTPWAVDLASFVKNYDAVKAEYNKFYGGDLSTDLIAWFRPAELSEFVAALWKNQQVMS
jgi:hypothetical protein